ncbi:MAG TPA: DUF6737 family protein [Thermosynechococcaceae cyanobacterium]
MTPAQHDDRPSQNLQTISVWQLKPWWCQPWSILLTGVSLILGSWFLFHKIWITLLIALPVLSWQGFFLLVYPRLMQGEMEHDRPM